MAKSEENGAVPPASKTDRRVFESAEAAREAGPQKGNEKWGVWQVTGPDGATKFLWANSFGMAMVRGAEAAGFTAVNLDKPARAVGRDALAAALAAMPEDER
jgi:hypothetical protein